nr:hypothetical protein [Tanacetum cinerariifolium]
PSPVEDYSNIESPEVDGPSSPDYAPLSPDYVPGSEEPEQAPVSPNYVPGLEEPDQAPPLLVYLPYVPELVYPEYMPPEDNVFPVEEQPLPITATPTADSPGYIPEFDPKGDLEEDDEEDPEEDPADYPADSTIVALPVVDHVPSKEVTKPLPQIPSRPLPIPLQLLDSPTHIEIPESCLPLRKRLRFTSPTLSQEVGESSAAGAARQDEPAVARDDPYSLVKEELYGFVYRWKWILKKKTKTKTKTTKPSTEWKRSKESKSNPPKPKQKKQRKYNLRDQKSSPAIVEPLRIELPFLEDQFQKDPPEDPPEVPMADNRTMADLLQAPTKGYEDAIVIPEIAANNFKLKHGLINLVQNKQFFGHDKEDPHAHIRYFNKITSTMRFFPPSKTTNLRNQITRFQQRFDESFYEAWDRFNDLLRACPHHGFSELHQLDTFYNALNVNDQDSLNSAAGGNCLDKMLRECLKIIESKSKVRQSRAKAVISKVSTSSYTPAISFEVAELKDMVRALLLDKKNQSSAPAHSPTPASVKAVEPNCVTCSGTHSYQNCPATNGNVYQDNIQEYVPQAAAANYNQGNTGFRPQMVANQIRPLGFPPVQTHQNNQNNFNRGSNFNQNQGGLGTLPSNTITNPNEDLKGITTRSGVAYQGPTITISSKVMKQGTEVTKDQVQTPSSQSTAPIQPPVAQKFKL